MNHKQLQQIFPAFLEIKDEKLRSDSLDAMKMAMEQGGWNEENIADCPVTLNWRECDVSWVEHVTDVTRLCMMEFDVLEKYYRRHSVEFCRDIVVAGALLHDIGKLTEFIPVSGKVVHGEDYEIMRHPLSGALIAAKSGLPNKIIHLIAVHSFEGEHSSQTVESEFVRTVDMFVFNCSIKGLKKC